MLENRIDTQLLVYPCRLKTKDCEHSEKYCIDHVMYIGVYLYTSCNECLCQFAVYVDKLNAETKQKKLISMLTRIYMYRDICITEHYEILGWNYL